MRGERSGIAYNTLGRSPKLTLEVSMQSLRLFEIG